MANLSADKQCTAFHATSYAGLRLHRGVLIYCRIKADRYKSEDTNDTIYITMIIAANRLSTIAIISRNARSLHKHELQTVIVKVYISGPNSLVGSADFALMTAMYCNSHFHGLISLESIQSNFLQL